MHRTYTDLLALPSFEERYDYLRVGQKPGVDTFGAERYLNQRFYTSKEWRRIRDVVITRDSGCDLGINGRDIFGKLYVHHMNPMTVDHVLKGVDSIVDPEFLITVSHDTHNAIHYGDRSHLSTALTFRAPNDTTPWRTNAI